MIRRDLGSPYLVHRQVEVGMDVFIDGLQFRKYRINICKDRCWPFLIGHSEILSTGMLHCPEIQATTIVARVSVWRVASWKKAPDMASRASDCRRRPPASESESQTRFGASSYQW